MSLVAVLIIVVCLYVLYRQIKKYVAETLMWYKIKKDKRDEVFNKLGLKLMFIDSIPPMLKLVTDVKKSGATKITVSNGYLECEHSYWEWTLDFKSKAARDRYFDEIVSKTVILNRAEVDKPDISKAGIKNK